MALAIWRANPHLGAMGKDYQNGLVQILRAAFASDAGGGARLQLGEIIARLEHQALAMLVLLFALPNVVPTPPGTSAITGMPLVFLSVQMILSRPPWLPRFLSGREVPVAGLQAVLDRAEPWLHRIERAVHPRLEALTSDAAQRLVGVLCLFLSVIIMLPIPFGNIVPALSMVIMAMGFIGRDGAWVLAGLVVACLGLGLLVGVYGGAVLAIMAGMAG